MNTIKRKHRGFTLIEVIVTIIMAAIAGAVVFAYMGPMLTRSHEPIIMVEDLAEAVDVMEEITAEYQRYLSGDINWASFIAELEDRKTNLGGINEQDAGLGTYVNLEITVTRGNQTVSALFTQLN